MDAYERVRRLIKLSQTANFRKKKRLREPTRRALSKIAKTTLGAGAAGGTLSYLITRKLGLSHKNALPSAYTGVLGGAALALPVAAAAALLPPPGSKYMGHKLTKKRIRVR
jgi:hypothetical protein